MQTVFIGMHDIVFRPAVGRKNKDTSVFQPLTVVTGGIAPGFENNQ